MIQNGVPLKDYSNYKIGGPASYFLEIQSKEDLINGLNEWKKMNLQKPIFILGKGTNILISDKGFDGLVIHNAIKGIEKNNNEITAGAGEPVSEIISYCIDNSLSGLEWAGGLPGTLGGAVRGNAGAFKGETKDIVLKVVSINLNTLEEKTRENGECAFDYRYSVFKGEASDEIIVSSVLGLKPGDKETINKLTNEKINYRNEKHPMEYPNIGSTFKNIRKELVPEEFKNELMQYAKDDPFPIIPVAKVLYLCNLKGVREGDAQISLKHPNFIVNLGSAKYEDVKKLIALAKVTVKEKYGIDLEEEIMYLE